jgi:hypothetical protein
MRLRKYARPVDPQHDTPQQDDSTLRDPPTPEGARLWQAVLNQALLDLTNDDDKIRDQARAWFEASIGVTCADFRDVCERACIHPATAKALFEEVVSSPRASMRHKIQAAWRR